MRKLLQNIRSQSKINKLIAVVVAVTVGLVGYIVFSIAALSESGPRLYLQPGSSTYAVGETIELEVRLNTDGNSVNAVQVDLSYPAKNLRYVGMESDESAFSIDALTSEEDGSVSMARGNVVGVSGDVLVAKIWFEVLGIQGNKKNNKVVVSFADSSMVASATDNQNILETTKSGEYTIDSAKQRKGKGPNK